MIVRFVLADHATQEARNSSVSEIGKRYRLKRAIVVNCPTPILSFPRNVPTSHRQIATFRRIVTFRLLLHINTITYLLTYLLS